MRGRNTMWLALAWGLVLLPPVRLEAGERIDFSTTRNKPENLRPDQMEKRLDLLEEEATIRRGSPPGLNSRPMFVPQPGASRGLPDADNSKNSWIFQTPDSLNRKSSVDEFFGMQQYGPDGAPKKLSAMEQYLQDRNKGRQPTAPDSPETDPFRADREFIKPRVNSLDADERRNPLSLSDPFAASASRFREREPSLTGSLQQENRNFLRGSSALNDAFNDARLRQKTQEERQARQQDFQKMLDSRNIMDVNLKPRDPFNVFDDSTRAEVNPSTPRAFLMLDRNWHPSMINPPVAPQEPAAKRRPSELETFGRASRADSLITPTPPPPPPVSRMEKSKPMVLEVPKRKF